MSELQAYPHSDLEVSHHGQHDSHKEAYNQFNQAPNPAHHEYYGGYQGLPPIDGHANPQAIPERRILGLKKRTFIIVAIVVALVIIAAALGGGLGATLGRNKSSAKEEPDKDQPTGGDNTTTTVPSPLEPQSKLAAVNYTDSSGNTWYAVFFQDQYTALIASVYDPVTAKDWVLANITASVPQSGQSIRPKRGTPIAAAANRDTGDGFQINLYYLAEDNTVGELITRDLTAETWEIGTLPQLAKKTAREDTQLGAVWHQCSTDICVNAPMVVYQATDQALLLANGSDWSDRLVFKGLTQGTPIAFFPFGPDGNFLRVNADQSGTLQELMWGDGVFGVTGYWYGSQLSVNTPPRSQLAGTAFGDEGWGNIFMAQLNPNGTLSTHWWNQRIWNTNGTPTMSNPDDAAFRFSSIAINHDMRFYGIVGGKILEYDIDRAYPLSWSWVSEVKGPQLPSR